jgi:crossover junction endodeoxyribonuclease RuvC
VTAVIGIDPGLNGAIALVIDGKLVESIDMPTYERKVNGRNNNEINGPILARELRNLYGWDLDGGDPTVIMERVSSRPGESGAASFKFGRAFGIAEGIVHAYGWQLTLVTPQLWKKRAGLIGQPKGASIGTATNLWPDQAHLFRFKKNHGRADAALIAHYGGTQ